MKINYGGLVGVSIISVNLYLVFILQISRASLIYELTAVVLYALAVLVISTEEDFKRTGHYFRLLFGSHLAFVLLTCSLFLNIHNGFFSSLGIFVTAVLVGIVAPYLIIQDEKK